MDPSVSSWEGMGPLSCMRVRRGRGRRVWVRVSESGRGRDRKAAEEAFRR